MRSLLKISLLSITGILWYVGVSAQIPYFKDQQFQKVNAGASITALVQDFKSHIWIGSSDGLYTFDGFDFRRLKLPAPHSSSGIRALCALRSGEVLAGTEQGLLFTTDGIAVKPFIPAGYDTGFAVTDMIQLTTGELFISTYGNGVYVIKDSISVHFNTENGIPDDFIYSLALDRKGRVWAGSDNGLIRIFRLGSEYRVATFNSSNGLPDNIVKVVEIGPKGEVWAGTFEKGVAILNENSGRFTIPDKFRNWQFGHLNCMVLLENEFWIGTEEHGILDYEFAAQGRFRVFGPEHLYGNRSIEHMLLDNAGNVWISSGNSLLFTPGERIEFLNDLCGNPIGNVRTILSDSKGLVWAGTANGLFRFYSDSSGFPVCDMPLKGTAFENVNVISLHEDKHQRVWLGTFDMGVLVYHPESEKILHLNESDGLVNGNVLSISGSGETVWLGTLGGVMGCYLPFGAGKELKPSFFSLPGRGPGANFIYKVFEDSRLRLIAGTDGDGVGIFDGKLYSNYGKQHGMKSGIVYSITEDLFSGIWVAVSEGGLYRFHDRSIRNFNRTSGLSDLAISALSTDENGNIIIVNKTGIDVLDPSNGYVVTLSEELGIKSIDPELNSISSDRAGNTWIGTRNGIIKLRLGRKVSTMLPALHLDRVLCFLQPIDTTRVHEFSYDRNHITFEYSGIWYDDPQALTYRYKLEGYNTDWVITRDRTINFPNLLPGKYTFRITAALNGNFKDTNVSSYSFIIKRPFWEHPWFVILTLLLITVLLVLYIRFRDKRTRSLEELNKERILAQFEVLRNQVNPHFLFNSFNTLISIIEDDSGKAIDYVNKLSDFFRRILTHKDSDLIPLKDELSLLEDYLYLQKQRYGDGFKIDLKLPGNDESDKISVPPLSLQMLVENAFKHNAVNARNPLIISIFINETGNIVIRNNKIKRINVEPSTGTGLTNLSKRYKLLCGKEPVIHDNFDSFTVILPVIR